MENMLLVTKVDGTEVTPLRVVGTRMSARIACIENATMYADTHEHYRGQAAATGAAFDEAWTEAGYDDAEDDTPIDVRFESLAGPWDYAVQSVEVKL